MAGALSVAAGDGGRGAMSDHTAPASMTGAPAPMRPEPPGFLAASQGDTGVTAVADRSRSLPAGETLLTVTGVCRAFRQERSWATALADWWHRRSPAVLQALHEVSFTVAPGEIVGILGESGSGKSTLARVLMGLTPPDRGRATLAGMPLFEGRRRVELARAMQIIFQDPVASLNPRLSVRTLLEEPLRIHGHVPRADWNERLARTLLEVGLDAGALDRYPGEFSGGQRQRLGICRALLLDPKLLIADEAVSALDVSVQAQIVALLLDLRARRRMAMLFIAHDVALVRQLADRVLVMYRGEIIEEMPTSCLASDARHPYTRRLVSAALQVREPSWQSTAGATAGTADPSPPGAAGSGPPPVGQAAPMSPTGQGVPAGSSLVEIHPGHRVHVSGIARPD